MLYELYHEVNRFCLMLYSYVFSISADELLLVQELCKRNIHACPVAKLQNVFSDCTVVECLYPILDTFYRLFKTFCSDITCKIWKQVCHHNIASLRDLVKNVWSTFTVRLQEVVISMDQLKIPCREAEELMPTGTAAQQLQTVVKGLRACGMPVTVDINVDKISSKVHLYRGLKAVAKEAGRLLCVIKKFELQGDFSSVHNIANVSHLRA